MLHIKKILLVFLLVLLPFMMRAQGGLSGSRYLEPVPGFSGSAATGEHGGMLGAPMDVPMHTPEYAKYTDDKIKQLEKDMNERDWASEETAWLRACTMDNETAYKKFIAMYPNSVHRGEADKKLIDISVDNALANAHNSLPGITQTYEDDDSPTSTITIDNNTEYPLTVLFSGDASKSIVIASGHSGVVKVENGYFRIAASVPPITIKPYAGITCFTGGSYQIGFWVVRY